MAQRQVAVIGAGVIGASWTSLFLLKGLQVVASDPGVNAERSTREYVRTSLSRLDYEGKEVGDMLERLRFSSNIRSELPKVDFVQENGPEKIDYKLSIFELLDSHTRPDVVLASSSSGLPASGFISKCSHPGRVLIGHPFNPPHLIPLVEVVPHPQSDESSIETAVKFYREMGKSPVVIRTESPGFVGNRLQAALVHEAYSLVSRGIVSAADVDTVVSSGIALRWALQGPFLTKVLGGGGTSIEGFKNHLKHVGKAAGAWMEDMRENAFVSSEETNAKLIQSVEKELEGIDSSLLEESRDRFLLKIAEVKGQL